MRNAIAWLIACCLLSCSGTKDTEIDFLFVKAILVSPPSNASGFIVSSNQQMFNLSLFDRIDSSQVNLVEISSLDFSEKDYLSSFGRKLIKLTYSKEFAEQNDACSYARELPVNAEFQINGSDSIYIYSIREKRKYRPPCP